MVRFLLILLLILSTETNLAAADLTVSVSIPPLKGMIQAIAGESVQIHTIIPKGASPVNYAPTPREMMLFSRSTLYFCLEMPTEKSRILNKISSFNAKLEVIKLQTEVGKIIPPLHVHEHHHGHECTADNGGSDPHIWLSPKRLQVIAEVITAKLTEKLPTKKMEFQNNLQMVKTKLQTLDEEIKTLFKTKKKRSFLIYHPSYGCFADDYQLTMLAVEENGRKATIKSLSEKIKKGRAENLTTVFYQSEFDGRQAAILAEELSGKTVMLDPLAEDYLTALKNAATQLAKAMQ